MSAFLAAAIKLIGKLAGYIAGWLSGSQFMINRDIKRANKILAKQRDIAGRKSNPVDRMRDKEL